MTKPAVMQGVYIDCKFMPGLKSARIAIDIPIEHSNEFLKMFGAPDRANPVHVAIARLEGAYAPSGGEESGDVRKSETVSDRSRHQNAEGGFDPHRPQPKRRSNVAAVLCQENQDFRNWLVDTYWAGKEEIGDYDGLLKRALGITSKKELDVEGPAAERWDRMLASFQYRHTVRA